MKLAVNVESSLTYHASNWMKILYVINKINVLSICLSFILNKNCSKQNRRRLSITSNYFCLSVYNFPALISLFHVFKSIINAFVVSTHFEKLRILIKFFFFKVRKSFSNCTAKMRCGSVILIKFNWYKSSSRLYIKRNIKTDSVFGPYFY